MDVDPYRAPLASVAGPIIKDSGAPSTNEITETELAAFAGGKRYPRLLLNLLNGTSRHAGFNIWAAVFGIQWYFYRKLYVFGIVSAGLDVLIPYVFFWAMRTYGIGGGYDFFLILGIVIFVVSRIVIGYIANFALCLKAVKVIEEVDAMNRDNETHLRLIAHGGGVSVPSLLLVYVVLGSFRFWMAN
jgi:hypothetical protein